MPAYDGTVRQTGLASTGSMASFHGALRNVGRCDHAFASQATGITGFLPTTMLQPILEKSATTRKVLIALPFENTVVIKHS